MGCGNRSGCYSNSFCAPAGSVGPRGPPGIVDVDYSQLFTLPAGAGTIATRTLAAATATTVASQIIYQSPDAAQVAGTAVLNGAATVDLATGLDLTAAGTATITISAVVAANQTAALAATATTLVTANFAAADPTVTSRQVVPVAFSATVTPGQYLFLLASATIPANTTVTAGTTVFTLTQAQFTELLALPTY